MFRMYSVRVALVLLLLSACASAPVDRPAERQPGAAPSRPALSFRSALHHTIDRPTGLVIVDVTEFGERCFKTHSGARRKSSSLTARMELVRPGVSALFVQEPPEDGDEVNTVLMAEIRATGNGMTQLDIFHTSRSRIADSLESWAKGSKGNCPPL